MGLYVGYVVTRTSDSLIKSGFLSACVCKDPRISGFALTCDHSKMLAYTGK